MNADTAYSCEIINPPAPIILKSETRHTRGKLMWAWVPQLDDSLKRMVVFVADDEPPVEQRIIENFNQ